MITALNYGKPPPRNGAKQRWIAAQGKPIAPPPPVTPDELDAYAGTLLEFQRWCEARGQSFKGGIIQAVRHLMRAE
jgi:hypothetical protein